MKKNSKTFKFTLILVLFGIALFQSCSKNKIVIDDYAPDITSSWNQQILKFAIEEDNLLTLKGVRTAAMMHTAIHDVLNSIEPIYTRYAYEGEFLNVNPIVATAFAAYEVALSQYPNKKEVLDAELNKWISEMVDDESKEAGKKLGKEVATLVVTKRQNDLWDGESEYSWHPMAPGVYAEFNEHSGTPEGFVFGSGWAAAKPFLLPSQDFFRSPPPPEINSEAYTKAFNEVKKIGSFESTIRTEDQRHLAMWWKDFVESSHNKLARHLIKIEKLNLWDASRAFALLNMTIYDAYVNVFDNKFHYNHWRPYTAIRWADKDGNPNTQLDTEWNNLHKHTYAFPSYPSAHGTASSAAMTVLSYTLGRGDEYKFTMTTEEVDKAGPFSEKLKMSPSTRSFSSFSEAGLEASISRVYLGIHFRYDSEEGHRLGTKIGEYANENFLKPLNRREI